MFNQLREGLKTFDLDHLAWVAEGFAAEKYVENAQALAELLSAVEAKAPATLEAAVRVAARLGPFAGFALASLARHAGIGSNVSLEGLVTELPGAIAGDLVVKGALVCTSETRLLVAGEVHADLLISSADVIVAGTMNIRDGVIGLNSWNQSMWVRGSLNTPALITEDYAVEVLEGENEELELGDESVDELLEPGLADELREWQGDGGPDDAVKRLQARLKKQQRIFR